ncbi:MAG: ketoacyl-ACP synthase III [Clostridioides sp.]|jgi:3-oxoacyl-[acyl-carrier-protein] synthase-3|nr:ketoacyl-ACP synthase III [Clostridioides sp.]
MKNKAGIIGVGSQVPEERVDNYYFEHIMDTSDEWITTRTGIKERRRIAEGEASSDLAFNAAKKAIESSRIKPEELDMIIVSTITPDSSLPSVSCILQDKLGAVNAAAFDLSAACSGFVYGLTVATQFIENGMYENILVVGVETLSTITNYEDRKTAVLFGDGAGAAVVGRVEEGGIRSTYIGADGSGRDYLQISAGGSRMPASHESVDKNLHKVTMSGSNVFKFAVRKMEEASIIAIEKAGLAPEDINFYVPHQANIRIIEASAKRLGLDMEKVYVNIDRYGNMSSASIPVAMDEAYREGKIKKGDNVVIVGFGGGLTWGSAVINWSL